LQGPIGCPETSVTTNLHCVTSQKGEDLIYTAAQASNQAENRTDLNPEQAGFICLPSFWSGEFESHTDIIVVLNNTGNVRIT